MKETKEAIETVRCAKCQRKLAEAAGYLHLSIKCPRCGGINILRAISPKPEHLRVPIPESERNADVYRPNP